jgi:hypothetical protein
MAEEGKGLAMAILGIVAVIAVVGLVLLFKGATGKYVMGSEYAQFNPNEACERMGCSLSHVEGGINYDYRGPLLAICDCPSGEVATPVIRPLDWREEFYPQG